MPRTPTREAREYDTSLDTNFNVETEFSQGHWQLRRVDGKNWGSTGIDGGPQYNGSGPACGPDVLVSEEQAEAYMKRVAELWNAAVA